MDTAVRKTNIKVGVLPDELALVRQLAKKKDIPISWVGRLALLEYLEKETK